MGTYHVYTDGSCSGNPGPGGYAAIIVSDRQNIIMEISGGSAKTTNNQMELKAIIRGLKNALAIRSGNKIIVYSDSSYCLNPITLHWLDFWKKNEWRTKTGEEIKNSELWQQLDELLTQYKKADITFEKVKGHSGVKFNELADKLACEQTTLWKKRGECS